MSEALRDVLKHLVGSAPPAVVLSARPADARDVQVNALAGCGGAGVRDPAGNGGLPGEPVCLRRSSTRCDSEIPPALVGNHHGFGGKLEFRAQGP